MRAQHGDLWLPPEAALGASAALGGDAALSAPPAPPPYKQWLLWGVLLAAALGVIVMVLKLMKSPSGDEPPVA
jgi:predicted outer membrane lipoprotein